MTETLTETPSASPSETFPFDERGLSLSRELSQFTGGTECWYRHPLFPKFVYTDGVKFFANCAGAYWFMDILATEFRALADREDFLCVTLNVADMKCTITADDGNGVVLQTKDLTFTNCPAGSWKFFWTGGVFLLPCEY
jgi:hypothetical protein